MIAVSKGDPSDFVFSVAASCGCCAAAECPAAAVLVLQAPARAVTVILGHIQIVTTRSSVTTSMPGLLQITIFCVLNQQLCKVGQATQETHNTTHIVFENPYLSHFFKQ